MMGIFPNFPVDWTFRRRKLRLTLIVMGLGMAVALIWHGWQGIILHRGYPYNTFLFDPRVRGTDFTNFLDPGIQAIYSYHYGNYLPSAYLIFDLFSGFPLQVGVTIFLILNLVGLWWLVGNVLRPLALQRREFYAARLIFTGSYPVLFCLDRGNIEILVVLMTGWALWNYSQRRFRRSFVLLSASMCLKLYPALLLLLFCRRRLFFGVVLAPLIFVALNGIILSTYSESLKDGCQQLLQHISQYNEAYNLKNGGIASSASAWNAFRLGTAVVYSVYHHLPFTWPPPMPLLVSALSVYSVFFLVILALLSLFIFLIEKASMRKAVLILLYMTVSSPGGGDYKLMYVEMALIILILLIERRPGDLVVTGLLAFCLIPKHEIYLDFMGPSDSGSHDVSMGIIFNPLCILTSIILLVWSGWRRNRLDQNGTIMRSALRANRK